MEEWRSRAVLADLPDEDAEPAGLVGEIGLDAAARSKQHADRQRLEHGVVAFEGSRLSSCPIGLKDDLRHLAVIGPARREWRIVISSKSSTPQRLRFWQTARR